jgi:large subunit ribosomal protein L10
MNPEIRKSKAEIINGLTEKFNESNAVIIVEYRGLSVAKISELRKSLKGTESTFGVYKNTLVQKANDSLGHQELDQYLCGSNAYIFSKDVTAAPKVLTKFAKKNKELVIKAGLVEGKVVDANGVKELANIPGREGLISMFLSCLQAPIRSFACTVKAVADSKN